MASRPVLEVLDLLGRRWSLRLAWELRRDALTFSELRQRMAVSPSVLSQRLRDLDAAGIVDRHADGRYRLSGAGRELARILYHLNRWAESTAVERLVESQRQAEPPGEGRLATSD
jgi:DNA-binding HxlR family transcriptional regulator